MCTLTHTHSDSTWFSFKFASSFFYNSVPRNKPQNPSLLLWQCFVKALAPTVSFDSGFFILCLCSSVHQLWGLLKPYLRSSNLGQGISYDPAVFLKPKRVNTPRGSKFMSKSLTTASWSCAASLCLKVSKTWRTRCVRALRYCTLWSVSSLNPFIWTKLTGNYCLLCHRWSMIFN